MATVDMITEGCFMATVDIASAYRTVSIRPDHGNIRELPGLLMVS